MQGPDITILLSQYLHKISTIDFGKIIFANEARMNAKCDASTSELTILDLEFFDRQPEKIVVFSRVMLDRCLRRVHCGHSGRRKLEINHEEKDPMGYIRLFLEKVLPNIPAGSTIVTDNAPCPKRQMSKSPTLENRK
jgi:hypothetical protein